MTRHSLAAALLALGLVAGEAQAADGAALFKQHCAMCHQESGIGTVGLAPPLLGDHWQKLGADRRYLPTVLINGLAGPIKAGSFSFNGAMQAFGPQLGDEDLAAIASHLRRLQGAEVDPPYTVADFAAARKQPGSPPQTRALRRQILGE